MKSTSKTNQFLQFHNVHLLVNVVEREGETKLESPTRRALGDRKNICHWWHFS